MKKEIVLLILVMLFGIGSSKLFAQSASGSDNLVAQPIADRTVRFDVTEEGESLPIIWGLDLAWLSEANIRRGVAFMGSDIVDVVRSSFMPTNPIVNGALTGDALTNTNLRISIINEWLDEHTQVVLNSDHPSIGADFDPSNANQAANWAELIDITRAMHVDAGRTVITVSPFNEPDYSTTGQGTIDDFYDIVEVLKQNPNFDNIRISGGNTLNCDEAAYWYNYLDPAGLTEGNTHQLAGIFDNYASFFETVRANGDHATGDELHNIMEAMVGVEYGMQTGIWWGTAEYVRGEFCKASGGTRLGYAEHRDYWTSAAVYRTPDDKIQGFIGSSERQAVTTDYRFLSKERDVYYDGHGPQREYVVELPGGEVGSYQNGQTNAETVVNITWGDDIQPVIDGRYVIVNKNSGKVMEVASGSTSDGANVTQNTYSGAAYQQWDVTPVSNRIGGGFSYFQIKDANGGKSPDVVNWSLDNGGNIAMYGAAFGENQQWYLEYVGDGWFYIRSRHSSLGLEVYNSLPFAGANIQQNKTYGGDNQKWRFLPVDAEVEFVAPSVPTDLAAVAKAESVELSWTASPEDDVNGYHIYRSETQGGPYNTIARNVEGVSYVDNTATESKTYYYVVRAVDYSLNRSEYTSEVSATTTGENALVAHYDFESDTYDSSENLNNGATYGSFSYAAGKVDDEAVVFDGSENFVQLPATVAHQQEITIATWVYWNGGQAWQRIFDFGNGTDEYMFLTPTTNTGKLRFAIKNGGDEQILDVTKLSNQVWTHVAVTIDASGAKMYVDGVLAKESAAITISPLDFKPVLNYLGRSQYSDPLFNGMLDDFKIYNYALSASEVSTLASTLTNGLFKSEYNDGKNLSLYPVPAVDNVVLNYSGEYSPVSYVNVYNMNGKLMLSETMEYGSNLTLNVADLASGLYMIKLTNENETITKKMLVKH